MSEENTNNQVPAQGPSAHDQPAPAQDDQSAHVNQSNVDQPSQLVHNHQPAPVDHPPHVDQSSHSDQLVHVDQPQHDDQPSHDDQSPLAVQLSHVDQPSHVDLPPHDDQPLYIDQPAPVDFSTPRFQFYREPDQITPKFHTTVRKIPRSVLSPKNTPTKPLGSANPLASVFQPVPIASNVPKPPPNPLNSSSSSMNQSQQVPVPEDCPVCKIKVVGDISIHVDMCLNTQVLHQMEENEDCPVCGMKEKWGMNTHVECCRMMKKQKIMEMEKGKDSVEEEPEASGSGIADQADLDSDDTPDMLDLADTHLQCPICMEVYIMATSLNCGHTFCQDCIVDWRKKTKQCPVCRARIKHMASSTALDQFIAEMFGLLDQEGLQRRREFVRERGEKGGKVSRGKKK